MQHKTLDELICEDLIDQASIYKEHVISEEALRWLINHYDKCGLLINPRYIRYPFVVEFLDSLLSSKQKSASNRYQIFLEAGERDLSQRKKGTVHYCALDLILNFNGRPVIFVADHYKGFKLTLKNTLAQLIQDYDINYFQAGGYPFQVDEFHCAIFTLDHLLETAKDINFLASLKSINGEVLWSNLPPLYLKNCQSYARIQAYVDFIKMNEYVKFEENSQILKAVEFDKVLSKNLHYDFGDRERKIKNKSIIASANDHSSTGWFAFNDQITEKELIKICYDDNKCIQAILLNALDSRLNTEKPSSILNVIFYNTTSWSLMLNKDKVFIDVFMNKNALNMMQSGFLNAQELFNHLRFLTKDGREIISQKIRYAKNFLTAIESPVVTDQIYHLQNNTEIFKEITVSELLCDKNCMKLFSYPEFVDLIAKGHFSLKEGLTVIQNRIPTGFFKDFEKLTLSEKLEKIRTIKSFSNSSIPAPINLKLATSQTSINVGFLASSLQSALLKNQSEQTSNSSNSSKIDDEQLFNITW